MSAGGHNAQDIAAIGYWLFFEIVT